MIKDKMASEFCKHDVHESHYCGSCRSDSYQSLQEKYDELEKRNAVLERAYLIYKRQLPTADSCDRMDASQEAQHYNWLDEQNDKLQQRLSEAETYKADWLSIAGKANLKTLVERVKRLEGLVEKADKIIAQPAGSAEARRLEWYLAKNEVMNAPKT